MVKVSAEVLAGLEAVRDSGQTNMFDTSQVRVLALRMGYPAAAKWIVDHQKEYVDGVFHGFTTEDE